jgi:hypothetical protein
MTKFESNTATNAGLIEVQIEYRAVTELTLDSRNPRQHSQRQINQLADSIREFGFVMPVIVDEKGRVVIGHGRVLAARKLGMPRICSISAEPAQNLSGGSPRQSARKTENAFA